MGAICSCTSMVHDNEVWQSFKLYYHKSTWWFCISETGNIGALWDQIFPKKIKSNRDTVGKKDILEMFFERLAFWNIIHKLLHCAVCAELLSCVSSWLWPPQTVAPLPMGFSRQEYWSGLPYPSPGDFPHPGIEPMSPVLLADSLPTEPSGKLERILKPKYHYVEKGRCSRYSYL